MQVNILEAKNRRSPLIKAAQAGEGVVIANRSERVARLVSTETLSAAVFQRAYLELIRPIRPAGHAGAGVPASRPAACSLWPEDPGCAASRRAQYHGCDALWTNDDRLAQASHALARNILKQASQSNC